MKKYESIFITESQKSEEGINTFSNQIGSFIKELGGEVHNTEDMGERQFARPIGKKTTGHYLNIVHSLAEDKVFDLKEKYRLDPTVYRVEVFTYDRPETEEKEA